MSKGCLRKGMTEKKVLHEKKRIMSSTGKCMYRNNRIMGIKE